MAICCYNDFSVIGFKTDFIKSFNKQYVLKFFSATCIRLGVVRLIKIFYSELCLINNDIKNNIDLLRSSGAESVELMLDGSYWNNFQGNHEKLLEILDLYDLDFGIHSPVWNVNITAENKHIREASIQAYKDSIIFASKVGANHLVLHPGFVDAKAFSKELAKERSIKAIKELDSFNKDYGVSLLIENVGNDDTGIFTEKEYINLTKELPESIKFILDTGHANITSWDMPNIINKMGSRLKAMHLNDNDGIRDIHLAIGEGTIEWEKLFNSINESKYEYDLILEYNIGTKLEKLKEGKLILNKNIVLNNNN